MNPDRSESRWRSVDTLLAKVLEHPKSEREAFLAQECGDDPKLRQEIEDLLAVDKATLARLDDPVFELILEHTESEPGILGPYKLESELGRGGSAIVYRATRLDGTDQRPVAIKILKQGLDAAEKLQRIEREGKILGKLRHPNIASVFGGGIDGEGNPYLVMELVEGEPIDQYCERHRLSIQERVRLLLPLCSAIRYAHSNLIVHRDLKPENILVTSDGVVKVLDFGISKLLDPSTDAPGTMTALGFHMLTPEYAAPEQLAMGTISTAVDVYTLGVVLYELLTGRRPFVREESPSNFIQRVLLQEPKSPSLLFHPSHAENVNTAQEVDALAARRKESPNRIRRILSADLDPILRKALHKKPSERYASVEEFERDLHNFLENRPVIARKGHVHYRFRKLVRRNRRSLLALAASLLVFAFLGWVIDRELSRQQLIAERDKALAVEEFMASLFANMDPYSRSASTEATIEGFIEDSLMKVPTLDKVPEFKSTLLRSLSVIYGNQKQLDKSIEFAREAVDLARESLPPHDYRIARAERHLANTMSFAAQHDEAEAIFYASLESFQRTRPSDDFGQARATIDLAKLFYEQTRFEESEQQLQDAEILIKRLPEDADTRRLMVLYLLQKGSLYNAREDFSQAESFFKESWKKATAEWGEDDARSLHIRGAISEAIFSQGRHAEGIEHMRAVVAGFRQVLGEDHFELGNALLRLGEALKEIGQPDEALKTLQEACPILRATTGLQSPPTTACEERLEALTTPSLLADIRSGVESDS